MKKITLFLTPIMAITLLANCGGAKTCTIAFNCSNCKVYDEFQNEIITNKVYFSPNAFATYKKFYFKSTDSENFLLPLKCDISAKSGDQKITNFKYDSLTGEFFVPLVGDLNINIPGFKKDTDLDDCSWDEINELSITGRAYDIFDVGDTKRVQLKHQDLNGNGVIDNNEVYQTVRIIDFNKDVDENGKPIGITFEFADLISDDKGYSLATQWNDTNDLTTANFDYLNTSIRMALVNKKKDVESTAHILWAQKGNIHWSNEEGGPYTNKSVLDMLPDNLAKEGILKSPSKYINMWNPDKKPQADYEEKTINDKLFLLSPVEMGRGSHDYEEPSTTVYSFYEGAENADRIKKQIKGTDVCSSISHIPAGQGQTLTESVSNYAGYNEKADESGGGCMWTRSPHTALSYRGWYIYQNGSIYEFNNLHNIADAVAPAFCI